MPCRVFPLFFLVRNKESRPKGPGSALGTRFGGLEWVTEVLTAVALDWRALQLLELQDVDVLACAVRQNVKALQFAKSELLENKAGHAVRELFAYRFGVFL